MESKSNIHSRGAIGITNLARAHNPKIGSYIEHIISSVDFKIIVRLSNKATIRMSINLVQDYEADPKTVTKAQIIAVANTFKKI